VLRAHSSRHLIKKFKLTVNCPFSARADPLDSYKGNAHLVYCQLTRRKSYQMPLSMVSSLADCYVASSQSTINLFAN